MMNPQRSIRKLFVILILLILVLAGMELGFRIKGYRPEKKDENRFSFSGEGPFFVEDSLLGFTLKPGAFEVSFHDSLFFIANHDASGFRHCPEIQPPDSSRRIVAFSGCSFTYGWGVADSSTFVSRFSQMHPDWNCLNLGVPAYNTVQNYLMLQRVFAQSHLKPERVVLCLASFHPERNVMNQNWRLSLSGRGLLDSFFQPALRNQNGNIEKIRIHSEVPAVCRFSAFAAWLFRWKSSSEETKWQGEEITLNLVQKIDSLCKNQGAEFFVMMLDAGMLAENLQEKIGEMGIPCFDASLDYEKAENVRHPEDRHPSALAHKRIAEKINSALSPVWP